jgi:DNA-binding NtrC family response regulator
MSEHRSAGSTIAVITDDPGSPTISALTSALRRAGWSVAIADAVDRLDAPPALIVLAMSPSREAGAGSRADAVERVGSTPLICVIDPETVREAAEWLPADADFVVAPIREVDVVARIRRRLARDRQQERGRVRTVLTREVDLARIVGTSPVLVALRLRIRQLSQCDLPVLITGETGTGKELCARELHYLGGRSPKPFLPVNCGAIPVDIFESELFGRERGAFTGAWAAQKGMVAEAEGGTLFLDEIETLTLPAQAKLLRFLDDHTYHSLGSPRTRRSDVRVIAATNVSLPAKVQDGTFREDLYHRLAVLTIAVPPLRDRPTDIPILAAVFLSRHAAEYGVPEKHLAPEAVEALVRHPWPGNVRELENVIREAAILTDRPLIEAVDLRIRPPAARTAAAPGAMKAAKARVLEDFERSYVTDLLRANQGNVTRAAQQAQKERRAFGRLVKKHNLRPGPS